MTKMFLSKKEFSEAAGISLRTTDNLIAAKELSVRRIGKRVLVPVTEAEKFARRDHATKQKPRSTGPCEPFDPVTCREEETAGDQEGPKP